MRITHSSARMLLAAAIWGLSTAPTHASDSNDAVMATVAFVPKMVLGYVRPIIEVNINGHPMPMMVHSNASFTMQLKHGQASRFGVRDSKAVGGSFGIERPGKVSALGQARGRLSAVAVGASVDHDVPVSIFEVPQDDYGMLGVGWIRRNRVIVDYYERTVTVSPTPAHIAAMRAQLRKRGYHAVPMVFDEELGIFKVKVSIGGTPGTMTIATASSTNIDPMFAHRARVRRGPRFATGSGPTGTSTPRYRLAAPIIINIGGWSSSSFRNAEIVDDYAYGGQDRPADPSRIIDGTLGSPFLLQTKAIVDFGNRTIYLI